MSDHRHAAAAASTALEESDRHDNAKDKHKHHKHKHKRHKRRRSASPEGHSSDDSASSDSESESGAESGDDRRKEKRAHKKHKHSHKKRGDKGASDKDREKEKEERRAMKKRLKEAKQVLEQAKNKKEGLQLLDETRDYFRRSTEFRVWLQRERGLFFNDLDSEASHALFRKFVRKWNTGQLADMFYKGIDPTQMGAGALSKHKWSFIDRMSETEKFKLDTMRDDVDTSTHKAANGMFDDTETRALRAVLEHKARERKQASEEDGVNDDTDPTMTSTIGTSSSSSSSASRPSLPPPPPRAIVGPSLPPQLLQLQSSSSSSSSSSQRPGQGGGTEDEGDRQLRRETDRKALQFERKKMRMENDSVLEELVPKKEGFAARVEKRQQKAEYTRRTPHDSDMQDFRDSDLMGGGGSFQEAINRKRARDQQRDDRRQQERQAKKSQWEDREAERMRAFKASMGIGENFNFEAQSESPAGPGTS